MIASDTGYPVGSQPFALTASGTTSAAVTLTQPAGYTKTFVSSIYYTAIGTVTAVVNGSITNTVSGTIPTMGGVTNQAGGQNYSPPLVNNGSSMVVTTPTFTGATATSVVVCGYFYSGGQ